MKHIVAMVAAAVVGCVFGDAISDALNPSMAFTQGSANTWYATTTFYSKDGVYQNQSVVRTQSTSASLQTTVSGIGKLSFWWYGYQSSSQAFSFLVDGSVVAYAQNYNWTKFEKKLFTSGTRTLTWNWNNTSGSSYRYGYLGDVRWEPAPPSFDLAFDPCGGNVDADAAERTYSTGNTYGTLPTPVRSGYTFDGWYTMKHGGRKIDASDFADWEVTEVYARWIGSLEREFEGVSNEVSVDDVARWTSANGMVVDVPATQSYYYNYEGEKNWIEAKIEGEAILSFNFGVYAASTSQWANVDLALELFVDGEPADGKWGKVQDVLGMDGMGSLYDDGSFYAYFTQAGLQCEASRNVRVFLTPGEHVVTWSVSQHYCQGAEVKAFIEGISLEPVGVQGSIFDFVKLVADYGVWRPGNMGHLRDNVYGPRIEANPNDYEARILRAAAKLGSLVDSQKVREIVGACGYTIADYTFRATGEFVGLSAAPLANDVMDETMPEIVSVVDSALDDLKAIPDNWTGRIEFRPEDYGYPAIEPNEYYADDKVYIGLAEVSLLRAAVEMLRAQLKLAWGYDYEADYVAVSNAVMSANYVHDVMASAPKVGSIRNAERLLSAKEDFRAALESVKRADAAIMERVDYDTYLIAYDIADAEEIAECRTVLNQVEASLDGTNTVDLSYFGQKYDTNGVVRAYIPGGEFAKQLFLGAVFAGRITRDLVPDGSFDREENRFVVKMGTIPDTTLGGLLPWVTLSDIARSYPLSQEWPMSLYVATQPQVALNNGETLSASCTAECTANLTYTASVPGYATCVRDGELLIDSQEVGMSPVTRTVQAEKGHVYSVCFESDEKMAEAATVFSIDEMPAPLPDGGPYKKENVDGVEITFEVVNGEAWIGSSDYDNGVSETTTGDVRIPATLGGHPVVGIRPYAFFRCKWIESLIFEGDEPTVESMVFLQASIGKVYVTRFANWPKPLPATWQGFPISYIAAMNPDIRVTASQASGTFSGSTTLSLSAGTGRTIYYTIDGTEPTQSSAIYSSPLAISTTMTVKFFAVDNETGDWGPVSSVTLTRVASESADIVVTPSVPDGTRFVGSQYVSLNAGPGKTVYYTTDGSDPMTSPTRMQYTDSIYMSAKTTLKYYAVDNTYGDWSPVQAVTYSLRLPDGGPYNETVNGITWYFRIYNGFASLGRLDKNAEYNWNSDSSACDYAALPVGAVEIPGELGGCEVKDIARGAFASDYGGGENRMTSVVFPNSVANIGEDAFFACEELMSVTIGSGVTNIAQHAFDCCSSLAKVRVLNSVTSMGRGVFDECDSLISVTMEGNAPQLEDDYSLFSGANSLCAVYVHKGSTGWGVAIPGLWCGRSIMYIEDAVFSETVGDVPWNYQSAGSGVKLVSADKLSVGELAGGQVSVPETINGKPVTTIGKGLFQGASEVTSVTLPATITEIEPSAFRECSRLEGIELPDGLAEIGDNAFRECVSLRNITIPATVTNIGYFAFRDCLRLETVNLLGDPPRRDLGVFMGVPAFTTISGRLGATTAVIYATVTNSTPEITVPDGWLDEIALAHDTPAGAASYQAAFVAKFGSDLSEALKKPTGKYDLKGNPLYVWQDYVAGTDPLDEEDKFTATITMEGGVPIVKWSPELPAGKAALRKYTTYGATALGGEWVDVSNLTDAERHAAGYQFFQVSVEMQ